VISLGQQGGTIASRQAFCCDLFVASSGTDQIATAVSGFRDGTQLTLVHGSFPDRIASRIESTTSVMSDEHLTFAWCSLRRTI
jgi:hypothetical protein